MPSADSEQSGMSRAAQSKVVWYEGMPLWPHHFQVQARFFETTVHSVIGHLRAAGWGFTNVALDLVALRNREIVLEARGVMPDGTPFQIPEFDAPPPRMRLHDGLFEDFDQALDLYLTLPAFRPGKPNVAAEGAGETQLRYVARTVAVLDEISGMDPQPVRLGQKNFHVRAQKERNLDPGAEVAMRIGRVMRNGEGEYVLDENIVPPCLETDASPMISGLVRSLITVLDEKVATLSAQRKAAPARTLTEQRLAGFWLLQTLQRSLPALRHLMDSRNEHPEVLYRELLRLAGGLCTFAIEGDAARLPLYDHADPGPCFLEIARHIRRNLELNLPTNCVTIRLERFDKYYFRGQLDNPRCKAGSRWVLGVRSPLPEAFLAREVARTVKISAHDWIKKAVERSVASVPIGYLPGPPHEIDPHPEFRYFSIDSSDTQFDAVFRRGGIGIYVPGTVELTDLSLSIIVE